MSNYNNQMTAQRPKFSAILQTNAYQRSLHNALSDPKEIQKFTAAITSVVSTNPQIEECDASTILSAALCGHSLGLAPSPQLGQYYMVPFKDKKNNRTVATFVLGYKGYIQLAIRSGQYKKLNVLEIKEGELIDWDPLMENISIKLISDETEREHAETIGYYAMFQYVNGFEKAIYWSKEKMKNHAVQYSSGYAYDLKNGKEYTFWSKNFDAMAKKTLLRQLISKWGVMSVEMQNAFTADNAVVDNSGNPISYTNENMVEADVAEDEQQTRSINDNLEQGENISNEQVPFSIDELTE